jgi:putative endonuclease
MREYVSSVSMGREGESEIAEILRAEGWSVIARNFRSSRGEIDLIAVRGDEIIFVEVKRWHRYDESELFRAINGQKIRKIIETSKLFLSKYRQYSGKRIRYDVMFLSSDSSPRRYEGAFDDTV